jgi:hypothetical protein
MLLPHGGSLPVVAGKTVRADVSLGCERKVT